MSLQEIHANIWLNWPCEMSIVYTKLSDPTCKGGLIFKYSRVTWRRHSQPGTARCNGCCLHSRIVLVQLQWSMTDKLLLMLPVGSFKCYQNTHRGWGLYYLVKEAEEGHGQVAHEFISRCGVDVQDNVKTSFTLPATNSTSSALKGPLRLPALMAKKIGQCGLKLPLATAWLHQEER